MAMAVDGRVNQIKPKLLLLGIQDWQSKGLCSRSHSWDVTQVLSRCSRDPSSPGFCPFDKKPSGVTELLLRSEIRSSTCRSWSPSLVLGMHPTLNSNFTVRHLPYSIFLVQSGTQWASFLSFPPACVCTWHPTPLPATSILCEKRKGSGYHIFYKYFPIWTSEHLVRCASQCSKSWAGRPGPSMCLLLSSAVETGSAQE